jgi:hypothetical protein
MDWFDGTVNAGFVLSLAVKVRLPARFDERAILTDYARFHANHGAGALTTGTATGGSDPFQGAFFHRAYTR